MGCPDPHISSGVYIRRLHNPAQQRPANPALPARDDAYDYAYIGSQADAIILMNYDQHWPSSPPGPIASQDWFVENIQQVVKLVPPEKLVMGIANYTYDWPVPKKRDQAQPAAGRAVHQFPGSDCSRRRIRRDGRLRFRFAQSALFL